MRNRFYRSLGLIEVSKQAIEKISKAIGIPINRLKYYNDNNILPDKQDLRRIKDKLKIREEKIMLSMGIVNKNLIEFLIENSDKILKDYKVKNNNQIYKPEPTFETSLGKLYQGDCISLMKTMPDDCIDLIFADPPFNLDKSYASKMNDNLSSIEYMNWCEEWIDECIRLLKPGGSFFMWNLPKWNTFFSKYLNERLTFKNWIATDIKFSLPINGKLYPSHYSLLYYTKGLKANYFKPDRMPIDVCKSCYKEFKDYGGYKDKMNPKGVNISDVWLDIPPVRHAKYKKRKEANELSIKLLDRVIEMSSKPGDFVFDPFGGSGTTYIVSELKKRKWIGIELGKTQGIIDRFSNISDERDYLNSFRFDYNKLFSDKIKKERKKRNIWTDDTFHK